MDIIFSDGPSEQKRVLLVGFGSKILLWSVFNGLSWILL